MGYTGRGTAGYTFTGRGNTSGPTFLAIGSESGLTDHGILLAQGNDAFVASNALTNGQLLIGSTGNDPVVANLTAGTGVTITNGSGTISIAVDTSTVGQTITGDSGGALSPTSGNWNIVSTATNGIDTSGSGSTLTVAMATPYADGDFEFRSAVSGATRTLSVTNTSNTASSQATLLTSVAGTTAGDTWIQHTVGSTRTYAEGIDNSDSQKLKLTTAASATANPSTANPVWSFTPATGYNYDNSGTSGYGIGFNTNPSSNYSINATKSLDGFYGIQVVNSNAGASASAGINFINDGPNSASISIPSSGNATAAIRNMFFLNAGSDSTAGIVYNVRTSSSHLFYANVAGGGLIMTANSSGLTMSTPLTIGTQQIFTTRQTTPSAGTIGEEIVSVVVPGSAVSLSTGTSANMTSISLTAGVWDITYVLGLGSGAVTGTIVQMGISTTSATLPGTGSRGDSRLDFSGPFPTADTNTSFSLPAYRAVVTSTTTYYACVAVAFSAGTVLAYGRFRAVRVA